jgi:hypothetical protein
MDFHFVVCLKVSLARENCDRLNLPFQGSGTEQRSLPHHSQHEKAVAEMAQMEHQAGKL